MIDLTTLSRVRFRSSTKVHAVPPGTRRTHCDKQVHLEDLWGRKVDEAMPDRTEVTCRPCLAVTQEG
ncbi:hypothetical protein [Kitasatospora sp. NPDC057223]|uniref:hypothetical protein n=1 Tax=Kitasatospora sp. NPDC057223 TaxID=3346055 RepID=UPI003625BF5D